MSELILIRHDKSDWSGSVNDLQRGLNKRVYNSCRVISKELKKEFINQIYFNLTCIKSKINLRKYLFKLG